MSEMGLGYGSEFQLLRFLGRHRQRLNAAIKDILSRDGVPAIEGIVWCDFPFTTLPTKKVKDQEIKGIGFLGCDYWPAWQGFWPDRRPAEKDRDGIQTWDAVGSVFHPQVPDGEWLLVEAKSHEGEAICSNACGASGDSLMKIKAALRATFLAMGCPAQDWDATEDLWLSAGAYQIANRLAVLHFLRNIAQVPARLLFLYFLNDPFENRNCPRTPQQWAGILGDLYRRSGFPVTHTLSPFVHYLCVDVTDGQHFPLAFTPGVADV